MLLLYSRIITPRLQYVISFFGQELFDRPIRITSNKQEFLDFLGPKINYSLEEIDEDEVFLSPVSLLFENDIHVQDIACFEINFHKAFFETHGDLHFDIFAATFYLLSRYEEYLPHQKDEHGRYRHVDSLAFREGFLDQPLVNVWLQEFRNILEFKFPSIKFTGRQFANVITYDVDIAYSYLHKGLLRNIGGSLRSLVKGEWGLVWERWKVLLKLQKDPFDCFEWLDALHLYCRLKPHYFFLVARHTSDFDKNVRTSARDFRDLVEYYGTNYNVGLHPSWRSGEDPSLIKEEKEWLEVVTDKEITASRQHYVRLNLPGTYRHLIELGITKDFSMGYSNANGFRASVSSSFQWYDLNKEQATDLTVYPFCFMDATSFYKSKYTPQQAYQELVRYYDTVKKVNGMMITVWHNHILGNDRRSRAWNTMFELFMKEMVYWDAYNDGSSELNQDILIARNLA